MPEQLRLVNCRFKLNLKHFVVNHEIIIPQLGPNPKIIKQTDFVIAPRHKAIPSVYGGIVLQKDGLREPTAVGFSGPTYIGIRSGKHSSSTALAHGRDFARLLNLEEFRDLAYKNGFIKPVVIMSVDGGPDENPRYQKVFFRII